MIASHIHHALEQVREIQQKILERQRFKGYSGRARAISGTIALAGAAFMASSHFPQYTATHVVGWGVIFLIGFVLNFGALIHWFLFDPTVQRDLRRLKPTLDVLPEFFVGGILTLALVLSGQHHFLFGVWMMLFGLANLASRHVLPKKIGWVGWFYVLSGAICLLTPGLSFLNPWPMGFVFFIGEWSGGIILHFDEAEHVSLRDIFASFLNIGETNHV